VKSLQRLVWTLPLTLALALGIVYLSAGPAAPFALARPAAQATPVTASATITTTPMTMGATDVTLAFAPGASGAVTVTCEFNENTSLGLNRRWSMTTTAESYAVTATFSGGPSAWQSTDVVMALDMSGPTEWDTLCYGCWTPSSLEEYPDGNRWPLRWDGPADGPPAHCASSAPQVRNGYTYALIEAEEYGYASNDYHRDVVPPGYTYWVMQRNGKILQTDAGYLGDSGALGRDVQGAYISHFPYRNGFEGEPGASGVPCTWEDISDGFMCRRGDWITERGGPFPAPRVDYQFTVPLTPTGGNAWYIWIRAQGGDPQFDSDRNGQIVFWGLDAQGSGPTLMGIGAQNHASGDDSFKYNGANPDDWTWRRLKYGANGNGAAYSVLTPGETYTLHLWAGSAGFTADQIIITNYSGTISDAALSGIARDDNRTGEACNPCDVRFGGYPGGPGGSGAPNCNDPALPEAQRYRYLDDLYDDEQPLAAMTQIAIEFIRGLDYAWDQIGLAGYASEVEVLQELRCVKSEGAGCHRGVIENEVVSFLQYHERTYAHGSANVADALEESLKILSIRPPHYGRGLAMPVILLITANAPDQPGWEGEVFDPQGTLDPENALCYQSDLWPAGSDTYDCALYMAYKARDRGAIVLGLTLGSGADTELVQTIADITGGASFHAPSTDDLDAAMDALLQYFRYLKSRAALLHRESPDAFWQVYPPALTQSNPHSVTGKDITQLNQQWKLDTLPVILEAGSIPIFAGGMVSRTVTATVLHLQLWTPVTGTVVKFGTSVGFMNPITGVTQNGIATATLVTEPEPGTAIVTASVLLDPERWWDSDRWSMIHVPLLPPAQHLELVAMPGTLPADGQSMAAITATVSNGAGLPLADGTPVTFTTSLGTVAPSGAATAGSIATTTLIADLQIGVATVTATAEGITGTVAVAFVPLAPHTVAVQAADAELPADGQSTTAITATVTDEFGHRVADGTPVTFSTSLGDIAPTVGATSGGIATATLTASIDAGVATVTATVEGITGAVAVAFVPLAPHSIAVQAADAALPADGQSTTAITAAVADEFGHAVADGTPVTFTTSLGALAFAPGTAQLPPRVQLTQDGVATATLIADLQPGVATVNASAGGVTGTVDVTFTALALYSVTVQAQHAALPADGSAATVITATVTDGDGQPVADATPVTFTTALGDIAPTVGATSGGVATATLTASIDAGVATVAATTGDVTGTMNVAFVALAPYDVSVVAQPATLPTGRATAAITATVTNKIGHAVADGTPVTFTATLGAVTPLTATTAGGLVTATFTSGRTPGRAQVVVTAGQIEGAVWLDVYTRVYLPIVLRTG